MKPKYKVLIYNFLGFAILFIIFRFGLGLLLESGDVLSGTHRRYIGFFFSS